MRVDVGLNREEILPSWRGRSYRDDLFVVSYSAGTGHLSCHTCLEPARQGFSEGHEPRSVRVYYAVRGTTSRWLRRCNYFFCFVQNPVNVIVGLKTADQQTTCKLQGTMDDANDR